MFWPLLTAFVYAGVRGAAAAATGPSSCVAFDINWNLLAFGFNGKDYNVGTQDTWAATSGSQDITTQGRPPFDSPNTRCFLSQFENAIYILNADSANPSSIHIYDATAKSWSTQATTPGKFDFSNYDTILDHDTNVFYAYSNGEIFSLDMAELKAATSTAIEWQDVQNPDLSADTSGTVTPGANTANYQPVMALAQNHVHFLGVPGLPAGDAKIFVIHFSFMQPTPQNYGNFPTTHGKASSFFIEDGVQQEFVFIPDDGSATYVVNVETNTTKTLTGPPQQDPQASYFASKTALVQLTTSGQVAFLAYDPATTTSGGTWATVAKLPAEAVVSTPATGTPASGTTGTGSTTAKGAGTAAPGTSTGSAGTTTDGSSTSQPTQKAAAGIAGGKMGGQNLIGGAFAVVFAAVGLLAL